MKWLIGLIVLVTATAAFAEKSYIYKLRLCGGVGSCSASGSVTAPVFTTSCELPAAIPCGIGGS